jgi:hypothetical protein
LKDILHVIAGMGEGRETEKKMEELKQEDEEPNSRKGFESKSHGGSNTSISAS